MNKAVKLTGLLASLVIIPFLTECSRDVSAPAVGKAIISDITVKGATFRALILYDGNSKITECGFCWSNTDNPTLTDPHTEAELSDGKLFCLLENLNEGTRYYIRPYARNRKELSYGTASSFNTVAFTKPAVSFNSVLDITHNSAICRASVSSDNTYNTYIRGFCWSATNKYPTTDDSKTVDDETGIGYYSDLLTGLSPGTAYYVRAYATNEAGTGYSEFRGIRTYDGTVTDADGKVTLTTRIGTQEWMAANLYLTHFNNGDAIETTNPVTISIEDQQNPLYQWLYYRHESYPESNGRLYTWHVAADSRKVCPVGWHVPSLDEWKVLLNFLGGEDITSDKITSSYNWSWESPWSGPQKHPGFNAQLSGYRMADGQFYQRSYSGRFWSSTESSPAECYAITCGTSWEKVTISSFDKKWGLSIRCLKDQ